MPLFGKIPSPDLVVTSKLALGEPLTTFVALKPCVCVPAFIAAAMPVAAVVALTASALVNT